MTQRGQIIGGFLLGETLGEGTYGKYVVDKSIFLQCVYLD